MTTNNETDAKLNLSIKTHIDWSKPATTTELQEARVATDINMQAIADEPDPIFSQMIITFSEKLSQQQKIMQESATVSKLVQTKKDNELINKIGSEDSDPNDMESLLASIPTK